MSNQQCLNKCEQNRNHNIISEISKLGTNLKCHVFQIT